MRLINADEIQYAKDWVVTDKIPKVGGYNAKAIYRVTKEEIDAMPTVDAVPVVHGRWIHGREVCREYIGITLIMVQYSHWECSVCGYRTEDKPLWKYCPNCGARMDGEQA